MAYWLFKAVLSPVWFLLWRVRVEGREYVPFRGPAVLAANHQSFCDSFFLPLVLWRKVTYLAKAEYFDSWRTAWFFRAAGQIPIRRGGGDASQRALETAVEVLGRGRLLALYPEGTRSRDGHVHKGKTGVARLARQTGVPVIPVGIVGTADVQPIGRRVMSPCLPVTIRFGEPMTFPEGREGDHGEAALRSFTDRLMAEICRLSQRPYSPEYTATSSGTPAPPARSPDAGSPGTLLAGAGAERADGAGRADVADGAGASSREGSTAGGRLSVTGTKPPG